MSTNSFASASLLVLSPFVNLLLSIILDITMLFHIGKQVTSTDKILKDKILIAWVHFPSLDEVWQYMLEILNQAPRLKVTENLMHNQVLLAENIGFKYKTVVMLLKRI